MLAMLAMLRMAPRLPSPTLRAAAIGPQVGTGKLVHQSNWKADFSQPAAMYSYSGRRCDFSPALTLDVRREKACSAEIYIQVAAEHIMLLTLLPVPAVDALRCLLVFSPLRVLSLPE